MDGRGIAALTRMYDGVVAGFCVPYLSREEVGMFISDARAMLTTKGVLYISFMEGDYAASGLQTRNNVDWVCTYSHDADLMVGTLKATGFEVVDLIRKPFEQSGKPDASDVFIYARAN